MVVAAGGVEPAFRGPFLPLLRHDAGGVRLVAERDLEHLRRRRHFEVKRQVELATQPRNIVVGDVPPVLAQVGGNAVGTRLGGQMGRAHGIRMQPAAGIPDRRHVIDVDAQAEIGRRWCLRCLKFGHWSGSRLLPPDNSPSGMLAI